MVSSQAAGAIMSGYIILLNIPGDTLTIDGIEIEVQGGFRGFHSVPPGEHYISMTGYSGEEINLELELFEDEVDVRTYDDDTNEFEFADANTEEKYLRLAVNGAMGIALWPYPPSVKNITNPDLIATIFDQAKRLNFLVGDRYEIALTDVKTISIGKDIIGLRTIQKTLFFQLAPDQEVLMPPVYGVSPVEAELDPWLWQNILEIIADYGD